MSSSKDPLRLIFFADTHLGFDYPMHPRIKIRRRGPDFFKNYYQILDYARANKPDLVIHGGDVFFRSRVPGKIVDMAYQALADLADCGIPVFIVPGNHERSRLPVSIFLSHPGIKVFSSPKTFLHETTQYEVAISGFPSVRDNIRDNFNTVIRQTGYADHKSKIKLLCMHQTVEGAVVGPISYTFRSGKDVININDIPAGITAVLSGHIHRRQILKTADNIPVIYPGSTERTSFAERDETKGFYDISIYAEDKNNQFVKTDFIKLNARPMTDIVIDDSITEIELEGYLEAKFLSLHPESIVRIRTSSDVTAGIKSRLTSRFLRNIAPDHINIQLSPFSGSY
ncbi:MAG: exonuclease SbcCD subunit D [Calditrichaceae bacterium]